jgi:hypothetical protein
MALLATSELLLQIISVVLRNIAVPYASLYRCCTSLFEISFKKKY